MAPGHSKERALIPGSTLLCPKAQKAAMCMTAAGSCVGARWQAHSDSHGAGGHHRFDLVMTSFGLRQLEEE
jgi:hypothetical protein